MNAIVFVPRFYSYPKSDNQKVKEIINKTKRFFDKTHEDFAVDYEDWVENFIQLYEASKLLEDKHIYFFSKNHSFVNIYNETLNEDNYNHIIFTGVEPRYYALPNIPMTPTKKELLLAEQYYKLNTFKKYANRFLKIGSFIPGHSENYLNIIEHLDDGYYLIKTCATKYMPLIDLFVQDSGILIREEEKDALMLASVHMEYNKFGVIIQKHVNMYYEYRIIVVNNQIASGAGCIEEFTPLDRITDDVLDPRIRKVRGSGPILSSNEVTKKYEEFANKVIAEFKDEVPGMKNYVLDLFMDENDNIGIIELNPPKNYCLYANDFSRILKGMM